MIPARMSPSIVIITLSDSCRWEAGRRSLLPNVFEASPSSDTRHLRSHSRLSLSRELRNMPARRRLPVSSCPPFRAHRGSQAASISRHALPRLSRMLVASGTRASSSGMECWTDASDRARESTVRKRPAVTGGPPSARSPRQEDLLRTSRKTPESRSTAPRATTARAGPPRRR